MVSIMGILLGCAHQARHKTNAEQSKRILIQISIWSSDSKSDAWQILSTLYSIWSGIVKYNFGLVGYFHDWGYAKSKDCSGDRLLNMPISFMILKFDNE